MAALRILVNGSWVLHGNVAASFRRNNFWTAFAFVLLFKLGVIYDNSSAHQTKDIAKNWCIREKHFFVNNPNEQFQIIPHDKQEIN